MQIACKRLTFSNLCRKRESDQCRQVVRFVGPGTSFFSALMVDKFHSVVSSQGSYPQWNALAFHHKCTRYKGQAFFG